MQTTTTQIRTTFAQDYPSQFALNSTTLCGDSGDNHNAYSRTKSYLLAQLDQAIEDEQQFFEALQSRLGPAAFNTMLQTYVDRARRETAAAKEAQDAGDEITMRGWFNLFALNLQQLGIAMVQRRRVERDAA